jgi:hypothetical protein
MKSFLIRVLIIVAVVAVILGGINVWRRYVSPPVVEYKIEGTAPSALVEITNSNGEKEYYIGVAMPHSYKFSKFENSSLSVSATNEGNTGSVKVSIYYKGKLVSSHASLTIAEASHHVVDSVATPPNSLPQP